MTSNSKFHNRELVYKLTSTSIVVMPCLWQVTAIISGGDGEDAPQIPQTYRRKFGVPLKKAYDIMNEGVAVNMGGPAIGPLDFHIKA